MTTLVRRQSGFSLIELMVAMTLGLILTVIIGNVFLGAKESYRTTEDLSRLQENARFAVTHLGRIVRMASYVSNPVNIATTRATTFPPLAPAVTGTEGGGTVSDDITVRYQGSGTPADGTLFDCLGNAIQDTDVAVARFHIAPSTDGSGETSLFCANTGTVGGLAVNADVELVTGVENMQILYGEDTDGDGTANRYLVQSSVANVDNVVSVRIALLLRTRNPVASGVDTKVYSLLGTNVGPMNDQRTRRMYTATIALRNRTP
jgi:type IV pilus assembly protein PilW